MFNETFILLSPRYQYLLHRVKFTILLIFEIPAYVLSLTIFFFFFKNRRLLQATHNQALLILLIINFIQLSVTLPLNIRFYAISAVIPATSTFCQWWTYMEFTLLVMSEYLMATISVQRHILVFHAHMLRVPWMRNLLYYTPILFSIGYPIIFYLIAIIFYSCDGTLYDYKRNICGFTPCYLVFDQPLGTYDWSVNNGLPMIINALANILLIIRVIRRKRQHNRCVTWRQQRRMTIQLFYVSSLYLISWSPCLIVGILQIFNYRTFLDELQKDYFLDLIYLVCLLLPWISVGLLPELSPWIRRWTHQGRTTNIVGISTRALPTKRTKINDLLPKPSGNIPMYHLSTSVIH